jgi:hypothetical protein
MKAELKVLLNPYYIKKVGLSFPIMPSGTALPID